MAGDDYYTLLGVSRSASDNEIKKAYRARAKRYHPDRNRGDKGAEQRFKKIQEAYEVLSDRDKRTQYDQFGKVGAGHFEDKGSGRYYTWGGGSKVEMDDLEDLFASFGGAGSGSRGGGSVFEEIFGRVSGGGRRQSVQPRSASRGRDVESSVKLTFEQALTGSTVEIDRRIGNRTRESISIKIPPNVTNGQKIRLKGQGAPGQNGGPAGNLYIVCNVQPHPHFYREGNDIHLRVPLSVSEAILGTKIDVPTLHGPITVTIPPGTSGGTKLRLKGKGVTTNGDVSGDQIVIIRIVVPQKLTKAQERAAQALAGLSEEGARSRVEWFTEESAK